VESVTQRASEHKRESPNNRTPEENAGKMQNNSTMSAFVKIPPCGAAPAWREGKCSIVRCCAEFPYRQPQPETASKPEVALS